MHTPDNSFTPTSTGLWLPPSHYQASSASKPKIRPWTEKTLAGKTLWDWLQLMSALAIPLVVVVATIGFGLLQQHLADMQHQQDQAIALDQQRATILQTYLDNIQDLLLNHNLLESQLDSDVAVLARARTLAAVQGLDPERKAHLVQFIYNAKLIGYHDYRLTSMSQPPYKPIVYLQGANLSNIDLPRSNLFYISLAGANLAGANLSGAFLEDADLEFANLTGANFLYADLSNVNIIGANLAGADLRWTLFTQQQLDSVGSCQNAILPSGLTCHH